MPVPTRRKITTGFAKEPQAPDNQVTNSSSVEASGDSREGFTVLGKDLGIVAIYPRMSRVLGESGKVLVEVTQGDLHFLPRVVLSSGFPRLDESALSATQSAIGSGLLSAYLKDRNSIQVSFIFRLVKNKDEIKGE